MAKNIIIAPASGFCFGVKSALNKVFSVIDSRKNGRIFLEGALVHNEKVCHSLRERGALLLDEESAPEPGDVIIIRAHGIPKKRREYLESLGCEVIDCTCPLVRKIARTIEVHTESNIILLGDLDHAEIQGLLSYAPNICVCQDVGELCELIDFVKKNPKDDDTQLPSSEKKHRKSRAQWNFDGKKSWTLICQSTLDGEFLRKAEGICRENNFSVEIIDTICAATKQRQEGLAALKNCDVVVVIGGKNSANTGRLFEKISEKVPVAFWVNDACELENVDWARFHQIGIAAGASTPPELIEEIYAKIFGKIKK